MMDTYLDNSRKASCTGCSACVQVCGKGAMHMEYDAEGFAYPVIDREKCVNSKRARPAVHSPLSSKPGVREAPMPYSAPLRRKN